MSYCEHSGVELESKSALEEMGLPSFTGMQKEIEQLKAELEIALAKNISLKADYELMKLGQNEQGAEAAYWRNQFYAMEKQKNILTADLSRETQDAQIVDLASAVIHGCSTIDQAKDIMNLFLKNIEGTAIKQKVLPDQITIPRELWEKVKGATKLLDRELVIGADGTNLVCSCNQGCTNEIRNLEAGDELYRLSYVYSDRFHAALTAIKQFEGGSDE